jgi:hypothetical protein
VNVDHVLLTIIGSFDNIPANFIHINVIFVRVDDKSRAVHSCSIGIVQSHRFLSIGDFFQHDYDLFDIFNRLTCSLDIPRTPMKGTISVHIRSRRILTRTDTDITGSLDFIEPFHVHVRFSFMFDLHDNEQTNKQRI